MKKYIASLCALLILMTACHTTRRVASEQGMITTESVSGNQPLAKEIVTVLNSKRLKEKAVTAKTNVDLVMGGKAVTVGGSLKMKRDEVIQLSFVALGMFEAGRLELTPDYLMLIDRLNHQYVRVNYSDVPFLKQVGVDFNTFQSLFWNELFLFGDKGGLPREKDFQKRSLADGIELVNEDSKVIALTFIADAVDGLLQQTTLRGRISGTERLSMNWQYQNYAQMGEQQFPDQMQISLNTGKTPVQVTMQLSGMKANENWETRTEVSDKYTQIPLETILKSLTKLAN